MEPSDSSKEDLPADAQNWSIKDHTRGITRDSATNLLEGMKVMLRIVEVAIAPEDILAPRPRMRRSQLQKEAVELASGLKFNPFSFGAIGATRRGNGFHPH
ncbi:hypothetical protein AMTRI_Chr07g27950 [Amborella trichopoda]